MSCWKKCYLNFIYIFFNFLSTCLGCNVNGTYACKNREIYTDAWSIRTFRINFICTSVVEIIGSLLFYYPDTTMTSSHTYTYYTCRLSEEVIWGCKPSSSLEFWLRGLYEPVTLSAASRDMPEDILLGGGLGTGTEVSSRYKLDSGRFWLNVNTEDSSWRFVISWVFCEQFWKRLFGVHVWIS